MTLFQFADIPNHIFVVHILNSKLYFTCQEDQFSRYTDRGAALFFLSVANVFPLEINYLGLIHIDEK